MQESYNRCRRKIFSDPEGFSRLVDLVEAERYSERRCVAEKDRQGAAAQDVT
jgi:hypothetical protein